MWELKQRPLPTISRATLKVAKQRGCMCLLVVVVVVVVVCLRGASVFLGGGGGGGGFEVGGSVISVVGAKIRPYVSYQ
jgi:hypothetical protein